MKNRAQSGNVLFLILIAVALFAALAYAVTNSTRTGGGDTSAESAKAMASALLQYGTSLSQAILRLQITNNCTNAQLSFENSVVNGYTNPDAPTRCKLFVPEGGGLSWQLPPGKASITNQQYFFTQAPVSNVGAMQETTSTRCIDVSDDAEYAKCGDIVMILFDIPLAVCKSLNKIADPSYNTSASVPQETGVHNPDWPYTGSFMHFYDDIGYPTSAFPEYVFSGKNFGCYLQKDSGSPFVGKYIFYYVIKAN